MVWEWQKLALFREKSEQHLRVWPSGWPGGVTHSCNRCNLQPTFTHIKRDTWIFTTSCTVFSPPDQLKTCAATKLDTPKTSTFGLLTSSCQFSLNQTIWSTMPSREESRVGCSSRCMCMIRLQRHIGAVARIGPGSEAPEWGWAPTELGCCCPDASTKETLRWKDKQWNSTLQDVIEGKQKKRVIRIAKAKRGKKKRIGKLRYYISHLQQLMVGSK